MLILFSACFVVLFLILGVAVIWSQISLWIKAVLIASTLVVSAGLYITVRDQRGWPRTSPMPNPFLLAHTMVRAPDPQRGDSGAVFYIIVERQAGVQVPRVYSRPYSPQEHSKASQAQGELEAQGAPVWMTEGESKGTGELSGQDGSVAGQMLDALATALGWGDDRGQQAMVPLESAAPVAKRSINTTPRGEPK